MSASCSSSTTTLDVREAFADLLEFAGWTVAHAGDGLEALEWLAAHAPPDVILLDLKMPRCDGYEFRARQLADPRWRLPTVVFTADANVDGSVCRRSAARASSTNRSTSRSWPRCSTRWSAASVLSRKSAIRSFTTKDTKDTKIRISLGRKLPDSGFFRQNKLWLFFVLSVSFVVNF